MLIFGVTANLVIIIPSYSSCNWLDIIFVFDATFLLDSCKRVREKFDLKNGSSKQGNTFLAPIGSKCVAITILFVIKRTNINTYFHHLFHFYIYLYIIHLKYLSIFLDI